MPFPKNSSPPGRRSDSARLVQRNKAGEGFWVGDHEFEMEPSRSKALEVV